MFSRDQFIKTLAITHLTTPEQDAILTSYLEYLLYRIVQLIIEKKSGHPEELIFNSPEQYFKLHTRLFGKEASTKNIADWTLEFIDESSTQHGI